MVSTNQNKNRMRNAAAATRNNITGSNSTSLYGNRQKNLYARLKRQTLRKNASTSNRRKQLQAMYNRGNRYNKHINLVSLNMKNVKNKYQSLPKNVRNKINKLVQQIGIRTEMKQMDEARFKFLKEKGAANKSAVQKFTNRIRQANTSISAEKQKIRMLVASINRIPLQIAEGQNVLNKLKKKYLDPSKNNLKRSLEKYNSVSINQYALEVKRDENKRNKLTQELPKLWVYLQTLLKSHANDGDRAYRNKIATYQENILKLVSDQGLSNENLVSRIKEHSRSVLQLKNKKNTNTYLHNNIPRVENGRNRYGHLATAKLTENEKRKMNNKKQVLRALILKNIGNNKTFKNADFQINPKTGNKRLTFVTHKNRATGELMVAINIKGNYYKLSPNEYRFNKVNKGVFHSFDSAAKKLMAANTRRANAAATGIWKRGNQYNNNWNKKDFKRMKNRKSWNYEKFYAHKKGNLPQNLGGGNEERWDEKHQQRLEKLPFEANIGKYASKKNFEKKTQNKGAFNKLLPETNFGNYGKFKNAKEKHEFEEFQKRFSQISN